MTDSLAAHFQSGLSLSLTEPCSLDEKVPTLQ